MVLTRRNKIPFSERISSLDSTDEVVHCILHFDRVLPAQIKRVYGVQWYHIKSSVIESNIGHQISFLSLCSVKEVRTETPPTFTAASLQISQIGTSLLWNQLRKSRNDLIPSPICPSEVEESHWSRTNSSRVLSFWVMVKFLNAVGIWDEYSCKPCGWDSVPLGIWEISSNN